MSVYALPDFSVLYLYNPFFWERNGLNSPKSHLVSPFSILKYTAKNLYKSSIILHLSGIIGIFSPIAVLLSPIGIFIPIAALSLQLYYCHQLGFLDLQLHYPYSCIIPIAALLSPIVIYAPVSTSSRQLAPLHLRHLIQALACSAWSKYTTK